MTNETFNTLLNIQQSARLEQLNIQNQALIRKQINQNAEIQNLSKLLLEANTINKQILQNQIRQIEEREIQNYYKKMAFENYEIIKKINQQNDLGARGFILKHYAAKIKSVLELAKDNLQEIPDKMLCTESLDLLDQQETIIKQEEPLYQQSEFYQLELATNDYNKLLEEKKNFSPILTPHMVFAKPRIRVPIWFLIVFISVVVFISLTGGIINPKGLPSAITVTCFLGVIAAILIIRERKWVNKYPNYLNDIKAKNQMILDEVNANYRPRSELEEKLNNHPLKSLTVNFESNHKEVLAIIKQINLHFQ